MLGVDRTGPMRAKTSFTEQVIDFASESRAKLVMYLDSRTIPYNCATPQRSKDKIGLLARAVPRTYTQPFIKPAKQSDQLAINK
jgi:hypothetical protein